ncbi:phosphate signaling complex protein PhoU [Dermabacteraceae bacterium P13088]
MRNAFNSDLSQMRANLVTMCRTVAESVREASEALFAQDLEKAERVILADQEIDEMQIAIDELAVELLARQHPVATDLRSVVSALRMSASLERMGDLAEHIALTTRRRYPEQVIAPCAQDTVRQMAALALCAVEDAAQVIETRDLKLAALVTTRDEELDALRQDVFKLLYAEENTLSVQDAVDLTLIARFYERLGDHAVSLVRRIGFLVTGSTLDPHSPATEVEVI